MVTGGRNDTVLFDDIWVYDHHNEAWMQLQNERGEGARLKPFRFGHVCGKMQNVVFVVAGASSNSYLSDIDVIKPTCNIGMYGDLFTGECRPCETGTFRSNLSSSECLPCRGFTTTIMPGATSEQQCTECKPGFCKNGVEVVVSVTSDSRSHNAPLSQTQFECQCRCNWSYYGQRCKNTWMPKLLAGVFSGLIALLIILYSARYLYRQHRRIKNNAELKEMLLQASNQELIELESALSISEHDLEIRKVLDEGAFGAVYLAFWRTQDRLVAVKKLKEALLMMDDMSRDDFLYEIRFIRTLHHRNIVWFYGANTNVTGDMFLVMEYVERGSLSDILLDESIELSATRKHSFMVDAAQGMEYLHSRTPPRIHRDLKGKNLLVTKGWVVKVADFTTAKRLIGLDHNRHSSSFLSTPPYKKRRSGALQRLLSRLQGNSKSAARRENSNSMETLGSQTAGVYDNFDEFFPTSNTNCKFEQTSMFGTLCWLAPEVLLHKPYDLTVDVYSFGIVMSEIASRKLPFHDYSGSLSKAIINGLRPTIPADTPTEWVEMMQRCWHDNPQHRPSFEQIVMCLQSSRLYSNSSSTNV